MENETCKHSLNAFVRRIDGYMRKYFVFQLMLDIYSYDLPNHASR